MASNKIKIGHYNLLQTIGVGSFGKVKLAVHSLTGHKVAMKILNRRKIATLDMDRRVRREIQYLKLLRHPHIIKLYEVITTPTDVIMVLEYLGAEMFNYIVEGGKMPESSARRFFQQIISAVEYCHRHRIVHRDLKPENLLLDSYNNVKITDFGLSNIMIDGDFLKTSCGSPNYAAPEVITGKYYAGPEVDVWSCGVILYVMLTGRLPFDDEHIPNLFKKINSGAYVVPPYLSVEAKDLLARMIVVDPLRRATMADIRAHPWFSKDLPAYLQPLPEWEDGPVNEIDESSVIELAKKLGLDNETILHALAEAENNQIKVSYQLVVDNKRMLDHTKAAACKGIHNFLYGTSPPAWDVALRNPNAGRSSLQEEAREAEVPASVSSSRRSSISVLSSSLNRSHGISSSSGRGMSHRRTATYGDSSDIPPLSLIASSSSKSAASSANRTKTRSKWHVGIRSRSHPDEVMLEVYRALRNLGIAWKTQDRYRARCCCVYPDGVTVKFDLQLYTYASNNSYLVDFKHIPPHVPVVARRRRESSIVEPPPAPASSLSFSKSTSASTIADAASCADGGVNRRSSVQSVLEEEDPPVTSIFPFFDVCTRLIVELAMV